MPCDARSFPLPELGRYGPRLGPTPLVPLRLEQPDSPAAIWCKLEFLNPSGSTKDRIARYILARRPNRTG
jgi:cysteine synthase A